MALTRGKIIKANNEEPDEVERSISQVCFLTNMANFILYFNIKISGFAGPGGELRPEGLAQGTSHHRRQGGASGDQLTFVDDVLMRMIFMTIMMLS